MPKSDAENKPYWHTLGFQETQLEGWSTSSPSVCNANIVRRDQHVGSFLFLPRVEGFARRFADRPLLAACLSTAWEREIEKLAPVIVCWCDSRNVRKAGAEMAGRGLGGIVLMFCMP